MVSPAPLGLHYGTKFIMIAAIDFERRACQKFWPQSLSLWAKYYWRSGLPTLSTKLAVKGGLISLAVLESWPLRYRATLSLR
jgi:hypothetical protein